MYKRLHRKEQMVNFGLGIHLMAGQVLGHHEGVIAEYRISYLTELCLGWLFHFSLPWKLWWALKKSLAARQIGAVPWGPAAKSLCCGTARVSKQGWHAWSTLCCMAVRMR